MGGGCLWPGSTQQTLLSFFLNATLLTLLTPQGIGRLPQQSVHDRSAGGNVALRPNETQRGIMGYSVMEH